MHDFNKYGSFSLKGVDIFRHTRKELQKGKSCLAVGPAVVVDVRRRSEPELCAVLSARVHHREVVLAVYQDTPLLILNLGFNCN